MLDAVVIGGGPVGSYLAARLAAKGYSVAVLEKKPVSGGPICCTGIISKECVRTFNVDESVIIGRYRSAQLFSPSGKELNLSRQSTQACVIDRPAFDVMMVARARRVGAEYLGGYPAVDVTLTNSAVKIRAAPVSSTFFLEARVAIDASGFPGLFPRRKCDYTTGAQVEVATVTNEVEVYLGRDIAPGFFAWLVPTTPGRALAGLMSRHNATGYLHNLLSRLLKAGKINSILTPIISRGIPLQPTAKTYGYRFIRVGASAGQVKPLTGGGIYYGLICADIAADVLDSALAVDDLSSTRLSAYENRWQRDLVKEVKQSYRLRRLYERLGDKQIDTLFDLAGSSGVLEAVLSNEAFSFDWHSTPVTQLVKAKILSATLGAIRLPHMG